MSTVKVKSTKVVKKGKATIKAKAKEASKKVAVQKVIMDRDLKYIYPDEIMNDRMKMKAFRTKVRNTIKSFESQISKLKGQALKDQKAKFEKYRQSVLVAA